MKALKKFPGEDKPRLVEIPVPDLKEDEVLVKVAYAGICKTDVKVAVGDLPCKAGGIILGHEFSGTVVDKDPKIGDWLAVGSKVTANPMLDLTSDKMIGKDADGCFAEYVAVPFNNVFQFSHTHSSDIGMKVAAYTEPVAAALGAAASVNSYLNGSDNTRFAYNSSMKVVIAGDPNDRIAKLVKFFVEKRVDCRIASPEELIIRADLGEGLCDCIIECCPDKAGQLMKCLSSGGLMVLKSRGYVGLDGVTVNDIVMRSLRITGAKYSGFVTALDEIWRDEERLTEMISERDYALEDFEAAFADATKPGSKKVMFKCAQ